MRGMGLRRTRCAASAIDRTLAGSASRCCRITAATMPAVVTPAPEAGGSEWTRAALGRRGKEHERAGSDSRTRCPHALEVVADPGTSWGLFGDFQVCPRDFWGTFRRVSREGPDSVESYERAGQSSPPQHSMMFTASPPRAVSLYLTYMSASEAIGLLGLRILERMGACCRTRRQSFGATRHAVLAVGRSWACGVGNVAQGMCGRSVRCRHWPRRTAGCPVPRGQDASRALFVETS